MVVEVVAAAVAAVSKADTESLAPAASSPFARDPSIVYLHPHALLVCLVDIVAIVELSSVV